MQRLAGGEHHVVGDVDDVRDRPLAGRHQPLLQPQRRRPDLHVLEHARREAQADLGVGDLDAGVVLRAVVAGGLGVRVGRVRGERRRGDRVNVARHAVDAHRVGPVRRDLELEHLVDDRQVLGERGADLQRAPSSTMIPSWSSPIPTSSSARIIPCDSTPRSFALPSLEPSGITAPGSATATVCPAATFGAPQTIVCARRSHVHRADVSRSASGCGSARAPRRPRTRSGSPTPTRCSRSTLSPAIVSVSAISSAERAGIAVLLQPGDRDPHAPNCSSKRASFS